MGSTTKNIIVIVGLILLALLGYYLYDQQSGAVLDIIDSQQVNENVMKETQLFIGYSQILNRIHLDLDIFEDKRFLSLKDFSTPLEEYAIGRANPFLEPSGDFGVVPDFPVTSSAESP